MFIIRKRGTGMSAENKKDIIKSAQIYFQEGKWDKAISEYKKLLTLDPTDYTTHNMLGDAYKKKGEDALAYQEYIQAAEAHTKQGLADKAQIIFKKIGLLDSEKLNPADRQRQLLIKKHTLAEKLVESGEVDQAIEAYKEIIKISPANFDTYQKLGELYAKKGDKAESVANFKKIVDVYFKNRLFKKALPIYQKIMEIEPDDISIREKIAEIYEREGNETDAKREYLFLAEYFFNEKNVEKTDFYAQKAVDFRSIEAHFFKGAALFEKKDFDAAKNEINMLLKFKANHAGALAILANVHREKGEFDEANKIYEKLLKAEPENTDAMEMQAELFIKKEQKKEAEAKLVAAADIHAAKQRPEKAEELYKKAMGLDPQNMEVMDKFAGFYVKQNRKKEAADLYIKISDSYSASGPADKAKEYYKLAEENDPANSVIVERAKKKEAPVKTAGAPPRMEQIPVIDLDSAVAPKQEKPKAAAPPAPPPAAQKPEYAQPPVLGDINTAPPAKKPSERIADMEKTMPENIFVPAAPSEDDVPSLLAMADSYVKTNAFDEAIEMYQKALALDPKNTVIKTKLTEVYSKYAGMGVQDAAEAEAKKKEAEAKKKKHEEEQKKKKDEEDAKKKAEEDKKKKHEEEQDRKKAEEDAKKKAEEERKKREEEDKKKKHEEEQKKKKEEEERKKKEEEEKKKRQKEEEAAGEELDEDLGDDFVTVTTAEIFIKQGLFTEAEKILKKMLKKDPANIEAKMKLDELEKLVAQTEKTGHNVMDEEDDGKKGKHSKVSYI